MFSPTGIFIRCRWRDGSSHPSSDHKSAVTFAELGAGDGNRTHVSSLGSWGNDHYTTPARAADYHAEHGAPSNRTPIVTLAQRFGFYAASPRIYFPPREDYIQRGLNTIYWRTTEMSRTFAGGCHCGGIRYRVSAEPMFVGHCHCTDCQKITGAHMATVCAVPLDGFVLEKGTPKTYATTGDSGGKVHRSFCPECGSTLYSTADAMPAAVMLEAGSLDDGSWLEPQMHIFMASAQPWDRIAADLPQFERMPPAGG